MATCAIIFPDFGGCTRDATGCLLPLGHDGMHEFVCERGRRYRWETDWECDCETCMQGEPGDYCAVYQEIGHNGSKI